MRLIDADALYEHTTELEATAIAQVKKVMHDEDRTEWIRWSAILMERTAFKYDVYDAPTIDAAPVAYDVEALRDFAVFVGWSIFDDELDGFFCEAACRKLYKLGIVSKNEENWAAGPEIIEKSREMWAEDIPMEYFEAGGK